MRPIGKRVVAVSNLAETYIFILKCPLVSQLSGADAKKIKHGNSPVVYVVLDPSYN